jgi:diacylglycerol kinase (ATP)
MKTCIILNPNSGSATDSETLEASLKHLPDYTVLISNEPGEATKLAQVALKENYELIVAAGGDGTVNEVANGLADDFGKAVFGIIPMGTGNDLVRTLNIPTDLDQAVELLASGNTNTLDVIKVTSGGEIRYALNVCAGGFSGLLNEKLTDDIKKSWGPLAYLRSGIETIPNLTSYQTIITLDDKIEIEAETFNVVVANCRYVASGIPIAPEADFNDGLLDLIIFPATSLPQIALLVPQILLGNHLNSAQIVYRRGKKIVIQSEPGMWFNTDGELFSDESISFEVLPQALKIITN